MKAVNYHYTRVCNYACEFCFFTQKQNQRLSLEESFEGIKKLREYGVEKINFAGGEPFVHAKDLGEMIRYAKSLGMATSVITNGSLIKEGWFEAYGDSLDMFGISMDSFNEDCNIKYGRGKGNQVELVKKWVSVAKSYGCIIKLNTVVHKGNVEEDMNDSIEALGLDRWKVFQVRYVPNENGLSNQETKQQRNAKELLITKEAYQSFIERHATQLPLIAESNEVMIDSYYMFDEQFRFIYNDENGVNHYTDSILNQPIERLIEEVNFNEKHFDERKGDFEWYK